MSFYDMSKYMTIISLALCSLTGLYVLFKCKSDKKNYFLIFIAAALLELFGYLLTLISTGADTAFVSMRIYYLGIGILAPAVLFFVTDYCEIKIHAAVKALLVLPALAFVIGTWTTDTTGFFYTSYYYDAAVSHRLVYERGPLFHLLNNLPSLYIAVTLIVLLFKRRGAVRDSRLMLFVVTSFVFYNGVGIGGFIMLETRMPQLYSTPVAYFVASAFIAYIGMKSGIFDNAALSALEAMNTLSEAVILLDEQLCFVFANSAAHTLMPWLLRLKPGDSVHDSNGWPAALSKDAFSDTLFSVGFTLTDTVPRHYSAKVHLFSPDSTQKKHWSVLISDVTESEECMKQLEEAAYTDTLTGLYNRRHFTEIAAPFIERARRLNLPYYVMIADLDYFKNINDSYGHLAGDAVLRNIAAIMKSTVRSYDIIARWGGEEFIFLITETEVPSVVALSERIRQSVEKSECIYQSKRLQITISLGVAQNDNNTDADITELILRADEALYASKQNGRNRVTLWRE